MKPVLNFPWHKAFFHGKFSLWSSKVHDLYFLWCPLHTSPGSHKQQQLGSKVRIYYPFKDICRVTFRKKYTTFSRTVFLSLRWPQLTFWPPWVSIRSVGRSHVHTHTHTLYWQPLVCGLSKLRYSKRTQQLNNVYVQCHVLNYTDSLIHTYVHVCMYVCMYVIIWYVYGRLLLKMFILKMTSSC